MSEAQIRLVSKWLESQFYKTKEKGRLVIQSPFAAKVESKTTEGLFSPTVRKNSWKGDL